MRRDWICHSAFVWQKPDWILLNHVRFFISLSPFYSLVIRQQIMWRNYRGWTNAVEGLSEKE